MLQRIGLNRNLAIISITILTNLCARYTYYALMPLHLRSLGANDLEVGAAFTAMAFAHNVLGVVGGALGDRFGRKTLIVLATIMMGPFLILAGLAHDWFTVAAMLVAMEACSAFQWPPLSAFITEASGEDRVAHSFSFTESAVLLGLITGPIVGAGVINVLSIPMLLMINGIVLIINGIVRAIGLRETTTRRATSAIPKLRAALDANVVWFIMLGTLTVASFGIVFGPFFAILARDAWRNSDAEINVLWAIGSFASLLGIPLGRQSDQWGGKRVFILAGIGFGVTTIVWGIAPTWEWGLVPLLLAFFFSEAMFMAQQTLQAGITSPETRASIIGIIFTTTGVIGSSGATLGAWLITLGGNAMPFIAAGGMGLLAILAALPIKLKPSA